MPDKAPFAFEWPVNKGWNAQTRLGQRISLEQNKDPKIWTTQPGVAAKAVESELKKLTSVKWNKKGATEIYTRAAEKTLGRLSEREGIIFRWMCFHIYLGGTTTSNPCSTDVFGYFHGAGASQCEFMYEQMKGPGMTGLYASCGYTKYVKELDAHMDEYMPRVTDMDPLLMESYQWCANRRGAISLRLVWVVSQMMNAYQQHHIDFCALLALSEKEWEVWCQQWHMYKRDYAIGITHGINPKSDQRYELVCLYIETITRMEIQEQSPRKKDAQAWVSFNPAKCTFCTQPYKRYENVANAASAAWNHAVNCAETNLQIKGDGPTFPEGNMACMDYMSVIEAKMTKCGGLDFETNIEWLLTSLVETAISSRVEFFTSLLASHSLSAKKDEEEQFGVNIPFLRLIANGQIFNANFFHPRSNLIEANEDSKRCQELLKRWIQVSDRVIPWGGLTMVRDNEALPGRGFSFSPNEKMGKVGNYSHPRLHPMGNQRRPGDVWILVPTTGWLPMGSFCGSYGYGLIHPNLINICVMQMSYASSHPGITTYPPSECASGEHAQQAAAENERASFDMMSIAPNFDLLIEASTAEEIAKTIVRSDIGVRVTMDRSLIKTPGSTDNKKGTPDAMRKEVDVMLKSKRFGKWMAEPVGEEVNTPDLRCRARMDLGKHARRNENSLARIMSRLMPHMGANIRAYRFLCFQTQLGYRPNDPITLEEVSEVIPMIIQQGWLKPRPRSEYEVYLSGGNLHKIAEGFKGKSRMRALWDITGYALQAGTWTNPPTVEMHLYQMATFWSMKAPTVLPTLPGIGGEGTLYHQFDTPDIFWNSKYIESLNVKRIVLEEEDKGESTSSKIMPKAVSKAPVIMNQPWDPVLGDSVHAFAWWTLSKEETIGVIKEQKEKTVSRPIPQIPGPPPVVKTPTTSSKKGVQTPPSKETIKAKTAAIKAPAASKEQPLALPLPELTGPPGPRQPTVEYKGNAGVRQPSHARGKRQSQGQAFRTPHGPSSLGKGTPSIPPETAVGAYRTDSADRSAVPQSQDQGPTIRQVSGDRSRSREPLRESGSAAQSSMTMTVPEYMLPIMAMHGVGHISSNQPWIPGVSGHPPPKAGEPSIHEFFESFTTAQDREAQVRAVHQFTAELLSAPPKSGTSAPRENPDQSQMPSEGTSEEQGKSPSQLVHASPAVSRETTPVRDETEKDVVESTPEPSLGEETQPAPSSIERGRQQSITQRLKSYWPTLKSFRGSDRRPVSPTIPPRSKADPPPRRATSLPRIPGPEPESPDNPATPGAVSPVVAVPAVQISAPTAAQSQDQPSAPEVTSDAETLALPGIPGTEGNGPPPSPVEEEPQSATVDPYVSTVEGITEETTSTEAPQAPAPMEHESLGATSERPQGFGGLVPVIPKPSTSEEKETTPKPVTTTTEEAPKEVKETTSSEPVNPATQPTVEAGTSQPPAGEAEASKPPSGEAESSKPSEEETKSDNPETAPKAKAKSVSTRKQKETPKETPEQKEQREKAEKAAEELVRQEEAEKRKQEAKDAKSKKAAAENKEKAREAAAEQRKTKEQAAEAEQTVAQKRRIKAAIPENVPRDEPPPHDDD